MIISSRLAKILDLCLNKDDYLSIEELSSSLQTSTRTIFREISDVDYCLKPYHLKLKSKAGQGIKIMGNAADKAQLAKEMCNQGVAYVNKEERRSLLIFEILRSKEVQKLYHYANLFSVSEATVSSDLTKVEAWFEPYGLKILRTPGLGIELIGDEKAYRKAMTAILQETIQGDPSYYNVNRYDSTALLHQIFMSHGDGIMKLLNQDILERVLDIFQLYNHELNLDRYAQSSYIGLIIHLTIAVDRILKHEAIEDQQAIFDLIQEDGSFNKAKKIIALIEKEFEITMPRMEVAFIAMHIKGAKLTSAQISESSTNIEAYDDLQIRDLIVRMIETFSEPYNHVLQEDEQLLTGLIAHLRPTMIRLKYGLPIYNPLLTQLQSMYKVLFEQTKHACQLLNELFECVVGDDEIGYLTMHFGAAMERYQQVVQPLRDLNVGIVCSSGIGVSSLLLARIRKIVDHNVHLIPLSIDDVIKGRHACELLISTFDFTSDLTKITVNPLLPKQDVDIILKAIEMQRMKFNLNQNVQEIYPIDYLMLIENIQHLLNHFEVFTFHHDLSLSELFSFMAKQVNEAEYQGIAAELSEREKLATTIFRNFHFALFHASSQYVKNLIFQVYYPDSNDQNELYKELDFLIFMLVPNNENQELKALMSTVTRSIIENYEFNESLIQRDKSLIANQLEIILKDYLFEKVKEQGYESTGS